MCSFLWWILEIVQFSHIFGIIIYQFCVIRWNKKTTLKFQVHTAWYHKYFNYHSTHRGLVICYGDLDLGKQCLRWSIIWNKIVLSYKGVLWHSPDNSFTSNIDELYQQYVLVITLWKLQGQWVNFIGFIWHYVWILSCHSESAGPIGQGNSVGIEYFLWNYH